MEKTKLDEVLDVLKQKGWTEEQLDELSAELSKSAFNKIYSDTIALLTDEDIAAVEAIEDDTLAQDKIKELYKTKTGQSPDEAAQEFIDVFAEEFLAEYNEDSSAQ